MSSSPLSLPAFTSCILGLCYQPCIYVCFTFLYSFFNALSLHRSEFCCTCVFSSFWRIYFNNSYKQVYWWHFLNFCWYDQVFAFKSEGCFAGYRILRWWIFFSFPFDSWNISLHSSLLRGFWRQVWVAILSFLAASVMKSVLKTGHFKNVAVLKSSRPSFPFCLFRGSSKLTW